MNGIVHGCPVLTFKPTIASLIAEGAIVRVKVELHPREQPCRRFYGTPSFLNWLRERLAADETSPLGSEFSIAEQIDDLLAAFISGERLDSPRQFKPLNPKTRSVWELKTPDVRIFGWFPEFDTFVAVEGVFADIVKGTGTVFEGVTALYEPFIVSVEQTRKNLGCEGHLCIEGGDARVVISF